ncbi:unnamed protein product [Brassicogethes aeneus]|uniref:Uncharacterized protein n=1 Tax=Brassicogethes aeneus TaxID=1431903 RepID=A0A9P0BEM7_BRAAE|nr:unnamed protein product [Brassicogethes aeneus]
MKELILFIFCIPLCKSMEIVYMKKSQLDDQASSASGYSYQAVSGNPAIFTAYSADDTDFEKYKDSDNYKEFVNFGYPPITVGKFVVNNGPPQLLPLEIIKPQPILMDSYGRPVTHQDYSAGYDNGNVLVNDHLPSTKYEEYDLDKDSSKYLKEHGNRYNGEQFSSKGEKGQSGYDNYDGFEKELKGQYGKQGKKAYYNEEGGDKKADYDVASNYEDKHKSVNENKGESFKQAKGHKKGSKTTGINICFLFVSRFHKVYHKDEYKKDHSFYDESDANGYYNKYGNSKGEHSKENGGYHSGGKYSKGYKESDYGKKGFSDKGQEEEQSKGYREKNGEDKYYDDSSKYKNHHDEDNEKDYGYDDRKSEYY